MANRTAEIRGRGLSSLHSCTPITEVFASFLSQSSTLFFLHDHPKIARRLLDEVLRYDLQLIDLFRAVDANLQGTALWGVETCNPSIHDRFIVPYVSRILERIHSGGSSLFWVHTCGKMKGLLERKIYHHFEVDLLECLDYPPAGDVDDWPRLRSLLPGHMITKGNLEDSLLWQGPVEAIRRRTRQLLIQSEGFKHILATSNTIFDGTPLAHFEAMLAAVPRLQSGEGPGSALLLSGMGLEA